jgi:heterodisulfide reductase subunit D
MTEVQRGDVDTALQQPFTPGMDGAVWAGFPDEVAVDPPTVAGHDQRTAEFLAEWRNASYNCFSSGHKFCREVCPVVQVSRNESWSPTAFHANVVAMERGHLDVEDMAADYVNCTQCGACELRCPNTLFTGDFYRFRTRTVDVVKAVRALAVDSGVHQPGWQRWNELTDERSRRMQLGAERLSERSGRAESRIRDRARPEGRQVMMRSWREPIVRSPRPSRLRRPAHVRRRPPRSRVA